MTHKEKRERRRLIAMALQDGTPVANVCREFQVSASTVLNAAREHGVALPRRSRDRQEKFNPATPEGKHRLALSTYDLLALMLNTELNLSAMAERLGMSRQRVHQVYQRARAAGISVPVRCPAGMIVHPGTSPNGQ